MNDRICIFTGAVACLVLILFLSFSAFAGRVIIYEHANFKGKALILTKDADDLNGPPHYFGEKVSSIIIEGISSIAAYEHANYGGNCQTLRSSIKNLKDTFIGNDTITSIKLNATCPGGPSVILFERDNYKGKNIKLHGNIPNLADGKYQFDNITSSLQLSDGATSVAVYDFANYGGNCQTIISAVPKMRKSNIGNDRVSSLKVNGKCDPSIPGVYLYEDKDYRGKSLFVSKDKETLKLEKFNDKTSSIKLNHINSVAVFEHEYYLGKCQTITRNTPSLRNSNVKNDKISSLRLNKRCDSFKTLTIKNRSTTVVKYKWGDIMSRDEQKITGGQTDNISLVTGRKLELMIYVQYLGEPLDGSDGITQWQKKCEYNLTMNNDISVTVKGTHFKITCDLEHIYN